MRHGLARFVRLAEIAVGVAVHLVDVLLDERLIRAEAMVELVDRLLRREGAENLTTDVAGQHVRQREDDDRQQEQRDDRQRDATDQEDEHEVKVDR